MIIIFERTIVTQLKLIFLEPRVICSSTVLEDSARISI